MLVVLELLAVLEVPVVHNVLVATAGNMVSPLSWVTMMLLLRRLNGLGSLVRNVRSTYHV